MMTVKELKKQWQTSNDLWNPTIMYFYMIIGRQKVSFKYYENEQTNANFAAEILTFGEKFLKYEIF